jgi:hypothetical protein
MDRYASADAAERLAEAQRNLHEIARRPLRREDFQGGDAAQAGTQAERGRSIASHRRASAKREHAVSAARERVEPGIFRRRTAEGAPRYEVRYRDARGVQRWRTAPSLADARALRVGLLARRAAGDPLTRSRQSLAQYADGWLERRRLRPASRTLYASLLRNQILPHLGRRRLETLTAEDAALLVATSKPRGSRPRPCAPASACSPASARRRCAPASSPPTRSRGSSAASGRPCRAGCSRASTASRSRRSSTRPRRATAPPSRSRRSSACARANCSRSAGTTST